MNDLTNFISHVRNNGVARSNRFRVTIPLPKKLDQALETPDEEGITSWIKTGIRVATILAGGTPEASRGLQVMCSSVQLPGVNIDTSDNNNTGHGFKMATGTSKTGIDFNFLLSGDILEKRTLDMWKGLIIDGNTKKVGYYVDYTTDIQIDVLDTADQVVYTTVLQNSYPILFNPVEMNKEDSDTFTKYQVAFTYERSVTPSREDPTLTDRLSKLTPVSMVQDVMNGDMTSAASTARDLHKKLKAGTLKTSLGVETFGMCNNVLNQTSGVSAQDMEGVVGGLVNSVKGTPNLDSDDSNSIVGALTSLF